ncbi:MAG: hypothetical protein HY606_13890 [Planctomycetes bacterium]|nr:hypothetical protein [Planctomycetota bacterium]
MIKIAVLFLVVLLPVFLNAGVATSGSSSGTSVSSSSSVGSVSTVGGVTTAGTGGGSETSSDPSGGFGGEQQTGGGGPVPNTIEWSVSDPAQSGIRISPTGIGAVSNASAINTGTNVFYAYEYTDTTTGQNIAVRKVGSTSALTPASSHTVVTQASGNQTSPDMAVSTQLFIVYEDASGSDSKIYLGKINKTSLASLTGFPKEILLGEGTVNLRTPRIVELSSNFLVIYKKESGSTYELRAAVIDSSGTVVGGPISISASNNNNKTSIKYSLISDPTGSGMEYVSVCWQEQNSSGNQDIYLQFIDAATLGLAAGWAQSGVGVGTGSGDQKNATVISVSNSSTGDIESYVVYQDNQSGNWDVICKKYDISGSSLWGIVNVSPGNSSDQINPVAVIDPGVIYLTIVFQHQSGANGWDLQYNVLSAGSSSGQSSSNGVQTLYSGSGDQINPTMVWYNKDVIVTWEDYRNSSTTGADIYANRLEVDTDGPIPQSMWTVAVCTKNGNQTNPFIAGEGSEGDSIIGWYDSSALHVQLLCYEEGAIFRPNAGSVGNVFSYNDPVPSVDVKFTLTSNSDIDGSNKINFKLTSASSYSLLATTGPITGTSAIVYVPVVEIGTGQFNFQHKAYTTITVGGVVFTSDSPASSTTQLTILEKPTNSTATALSASQIKIDFQWNGSGTLPAGFKILRRLGGSSSNFIDIGTSVTYSSSTSNYSITDTGLQDETTYEYTLRAYSGSNTSDYTSPVSATTEENNGGSTAPPPPPPSGGSEPPGNPPPSSGGESYIPDPPSSESGNNSNVSSSKKSSSAPTCYMATSSHNSYSAGLVTQFINFRDGVLHSNLYGKLSTRSYRNLAPSLAAKIAQEPVFGSGVKQILSYFVSIMGISLLVILTVCIRVLKR